MQFRAMVQASFTINPLQTCMLHRLNPFSPNIDQHQFSPNDIHMLPREMVMGVNKMITKGKML